MIKVRKYMILGSLLIILIVPIFFGTFLKYLTIREINGYIVLIFIIGIIILLFLSKIIEVFVYNNENVEVIKKQDVMNAFINRNNRVIIWFFFPMIIIIEELLFRYYLFGVLICFLKFELIVVILISSVAFSLFHIHIWFRYRNLHIFLINLIYPFLLGLFNSYVLLTFGLLPCIAIHYTIALYAYYGIYKRYFKAYSIKKNKNCS